MNKSYDVVTFGDNLSGLLTAALMKDKGADVLVICAPPSHKTAKGFQLDMQAVPLVCIPDTPAVAEILYKLDISLRNGELFYPASPLFQVVFGRYRIDMPPSRDRSAEVLDVEFPGEIETLLRAVPGSGKIREEISVRAQKGKDIFPPHDLRSRISSWVRGNRGTNPSTGGIAPSFDFSPSLKKFISICLESSIPVRPVPDDISLLPFPIESLNYYYPKGGMTGLKKLIINGLENRGVDVAAPCPIQSLIIRKKSVTAVNFGSDSVPVETKALIFNSAPSMLPSILPESIFTKGFRKMLAGRRPWGRWRSLFLAVDEEKIPAGMRDTLIAGREKGPPLLLQIEPGTGEGSGSGGMRLMKVSTPVHMGDDSTGDAESFKEFERGVIEVLTELMPFLDKRFEIIDRYDEEPPTYDSCLLSGPLKGPLRLGMLSPFTPYRNLFISAREIIATLGIYGDFISAEIIASHASEAIFKV